MAKDSLQDNNVAQDAFTEANPFGRNKRAREILASQPGQTSHQSIQEVAATLESEGKAHPGKLGHMQPRQVGRPARITAKPQFTPETE